MRAAVELVSSVVSTIAAIFSFEYVLSLLKSAYSLDSPMGATLGLLSQGRAYEACEYGTGFGP